MRPVTITRAVRFSAAHRYENPDLSEARNRELFGACYRPHGHGHNYRVEVTVKGQIDPVTGMVMNLSDLDRILREHVVSVFDHSFLNHDVPHFATVIPTCENIAAYLFGVLERPVAEAAGAQLSGLRVWESDDLSAEVRSESRR